MRKILLIISLFISFTVSASSLSEDLNTYFTQLDSSENDSISISINEKIKKEVLSFAEVDSNFYKTALDCKRIGSVISSDNKLKIISWNYKLSDGKFGYEAIIIKNSNKKKPKVKVWKASCKEAFKPADNKRYSLSKWYGALYYNIIPWKGNYILLGYSTYNNISKVKVIELLSFENKKPSFGEKVFKKENKVYQRMVFEYSHMANMSLIYNEERNEFIFDHLSPEEPSMKGLYQYYGPDFSVDILKESRKFWEYKEDVDVRNN